LELSDSFCQIFVNFSFALKFQANPASIALNDKYWSTMLSRVLFTRHKIKKKWTGTALTSKPQNMSFGIAFMV